MQPTEVPPVHLSLIAGECAQPQVGLTGASRADLRDDVPEVLYDGVRVTLEDARAVSADDSDWTLAPRQNRTVEIVLDEPVWIVDDVMQGLSLDIDFAASLF